jgi:hypothetical protein
MMNEPEFVHPPGCTVSAFEPVSCLKHTTMRQKTDPAAQRYDPTMLPKKRQR